MGECNLHNFNGKVEACSAGRSLLSRSRAGGGEDEVTTDTDTFFKRFNVRRGRNLLSWTVTASNELAQLSDAIRIVRIDILGKY